MSTDRQSCDNLKTNLKTTVFIMSLNDENHSKMTGPELRDNWNKHQHATSIENYQKNQKNYFTAVSLHISHLKCVKGWYLHLRGVCCFKMKRQACFNPNFSSTTTVSSITLSHINLTFMVEIQKQKSLQLCPFNLSLVLSPLKRAQKKSWQLDFKSKSLNIVCVHISADLRVLILVQYLLSPVL